MVCAALEDRGVPHNSKVRLSGGTIETTNGGAPGESLGNVLYPELADLLVDHDQVRTSRHAGPRFHVMPVQHFTSMPVQSFTACRSRISRQGGPD